jgi:transcriptional regulator with XRE-family HTH domain
MSSTHPREPSASAALADNVRRRRDAAGLTPAELAALAGTAKGTVLGIERGRANPTVDTVQALAGALGCSIADLLDGSPDPMMTVRGAGEPYSRIGALEGRLLQRFSPTGPVEVFEMLLASKRARESPPHPDGVYEHIWVSSGRLIAGPVDDPVELGPGDYICFPGWRRHRYRALEVPVRMVMMLSLKRSLPEAPALHHRD